MKTKQIVFSIIFFVLAILVGALGIVGACINSDNSYAVGFSISFSISLIIMGLLIVITSLIKPSINKKLDERQIRATGSAAHMALFCLISTLIIDSIVRGIFGIDWCDYLNTVIIHMFIAISVYVIACILMNAYVKNIKPKLSILFFLCALSFITISFIDVDTEGLFKDGMITSNMVVLLGGVIFFLYGIAVLIRCRLNKLEEIKLDKEEKEELLSLQRNEEETKGDEEFKA